jgi:glycosyltransferase involved in cell wall biosynthesis
VHFLGARGDVPDLMNAADVVIHASTVAEPFGLVVVEAMALGRPVIASKLGGPGEIVAPGTGWTFDPTEPRQLARCIEEALGDPARAREVGRAAIERANAFSIEATVAGVERVYTEVLGASALEARARLIAPSQSGRSVEALTP